MVYGIVKLLLYILGCSWAFSMLVMLGYYAIDSFIEKHRED